MAILYIQISQNKRKHVSSSDLLYNIYSLPPCFQDLLSFFSGYCFVLLCKVCVLKNNFLIFFFVEIQLKHNFFLVSNPTLKKSSAFFHFLPSYTIYLSIAVFEIKSIDLIDIERKKNLKNDYVRLYKHTHSAKKFLQNPTPTISVCLCV